MSELLRASVRFFENLTSKEVRTLLSWVTRLCSPLKSTKCRGGGELCGR
jgi:hypothetical protein